MSNFTIFKNTCADTWHAYIHHDFVEQVYKGILPLENFQFYLKQDYVFLMEYARAWGHALTLSKTPDQFDFAFKGIASILDGEIDMHIQYCKHWNISAEQVFATTAHPSNTAYTQYVIACGLEGGFTDLITALAPCAIGYAEIGAWMQQQGHTKNNPYQSWINMYASPEFQQMATDFIRFINTLYTDLKHTEIAKQSAIFKHATALEIGFWDMAMAGK